MRILLTTTSYQDTPGKHHDVLKASGFDVVRARVRDARGPDAGRHEPVERRKNRALDADERRLEAPPAALDGLENAY